MRTFLRLPFLALASLCLAGCGETPTEKETEESDSLTAEEKAIQTAAKPFLNALASGDHAAAYAQLSSHAKARMSPSQFFPPKDEAEHAANEKKAVANASERDFQVFVARVANEYGVPSKLISANQIETDPKILGGGGDAMDTAFTIGLMPASIPAEIRKGAVRAQIGVRLPASQLKEIADQQGMTVEDLQKSEDFEPYCNVKVVLVEEGGTLKVGYFEFTPPSMWD
jgi:hypothetical protein